MDVKFSNSEAFTDLIFSQSRSLAMRFAHDRNTSENHRPRSQNNTRTQNFKKYDRMDTRPAFESPKNLEILITQLKEENTRLKQELENMRKINKKLLKTEKLSNEDYQNFYQTILVEHLQKKIENLGEEANYYRLETQKASVERDFLKKDKKYIQALANRYKTLSLENQKKTITKSTTSASSEKNKPCLLTFEKKLTFLNEFILKIQDETNFLHLLSAIAGFLQKIFKAEKISMILVSDDIRELYTNYSKKYFSQQWNNKTVIVAEGPYLSQVELQSLSPEQMKSGFISGKELYSTIYFQNIPSIYICLSNKSVAKGDSSLFSSSEYNYFHLITTCASLVLKYTKTKERETKEMQHVLELTELLSNIINNKNHKELANNIYSYIPRFLEFKSAGIIFIDQLKNEFFGMLPSESIYEKFSNTTTRFSIDLGITGEVYKKGGILRFDDLKIHRLFNSEIDNPVRCSTLTNCVFANLIGLDNSIVGILQVFHKLDNKPVTERDIEKIKSLQKILGICVSCTNIINETSSLTINFKQTVEHAVLSIDEIDNTQTGSELSEIKKYLNGMKNSMNDWANHKKQKSFYLG